MTRRRWRPDTSDLVAHGQEIGYLLCKSAHLDAPQDYFEACRRDGLPVVIVAIPRTSAAIEYFAPPGRKLSPAAQQRIRDCAEAAFTGSVTKKRSIIVGADTGDIRGIHRDKATAFAAMLADLLRDEASYQEGKLLVFPGHPETGGGVMNLTPRAANQLRTLDPGDVAAILDHLDDRRYGPGSSLVEIETTGGTVRCFVARHRDGSLVLLSIVHLRQEAS